MDSFALIPQIPPAALLATWLGLSAIIALRYLLISGLFYWLLWKRPPEKVRAIKLMRGQPQPGVVQREIGWSLLSSFIYGAPAAVVIELWKLGDSAVHVDAAAFPLWWLRALPGATSSPPRTMICTTRIRGSTSALYFRFWDKRMGTDVMESEYDFLAARREQQTREAA